MKILILDAPAQRGRHANHQVDVMVFRQFCPAVDDVAVILRRLGEPVRVVHTVVIKEHALNLVSFFNRGLREQVRRVRRLMRIRPLVDQNTQLHHCPPDRCQIYC